MFSSNKPESFYSLSLISLLGTLGASALMVMPILVYSYVDFAGFTESDAGLIASTNLFGIAVSAIIVTFGVRRWPLRTMSLWGLVILIVGDFATASTSELAYFQVARFISGLGGGTVFATVMAAIARLSFAEKGYGIFMVFQFGVSAILIVLLEMLLIGWGITTLFYVLGGLAAMSMLLLPVLSHYDDIKVQQDSSKIDWVAILSLPAILSILAVLLFEAGNSALWVYFERVGADIGFASEKLAAALGASTFLAILGGFAVMVIGTRFGRFIPVTIGIVLISLTAYFVFSVDTLFEYGLASFLFQASWAFTLPFIQGAQAEMDRLGSVAVAGQFATMLGASLGPFVAAFGISGGGIGMLSFIVIAFYLSSCVVVGPVFRMLGKRI